MLGNPERVFSLSLSSLSPNIELVDDPPKILVVVEEDPPKRDPEDVVLGGKFPNKVRLEPSVGTSSVVFFGREEAKKFGMVEEGLLSGLVALPKPKVGAGGPPEDSEVGAGVKGNANPLNGFEVSVDVGRLKLPGLEPMGGRMEFSKGFDPDVLGCTGEDNLGVGEVEGADVLDKFGALKRIDGPGSGPRGRVFLGELLKEPASCLSHTAWMVRRLAAYWSKTWQRSTKGSSLTAFVRNVASEWFKPRMLL